MVDTSTGNVKRDDIFGRYTGEKLSAVTFVLDYWQFQFDGPSINVLTRVEVDDGQTITRDGEDQFRNRLCEQIGKIVHSVNKTKHALIIAFEDQSSISISLKVSDFRGPEAAVLFGPNNFVTCVIRAGD